MRVTFNEFVRRANEKHNFKYNLKEHPYSYIIGRY